MFINDKLFLIDKNPFLLTAKQIKRKHPVEGREMQIRFFSYLRKYGVLTIKYAFFLFNLSLLAGLGIKTVNLWIASPFDFSDTLNAFPDEPEWTVRAVAEHQFWTATVIETLLFIIGGFLCYEILIKHKTFRRSIVAPIAVAFLFTAGESVPLFLPATEKVQQINACKAMNISWDTQNHTCRLMDLELKRFEELKLRKKPKATTETAQGKDAAPSPAEAQNGAEAPKKKYRRRKIRP